ncbi:MAG TPA: hypothetical protein PLR22_04980 [Saprospiraceae bacterium]|nr:hypothetical protein [Saprospiraceae bacterium]
MPNILELMGVTILHEIGFTVIIISGSVMIWRNDHKDGGMMAYKKFQ